MTLTNTGPAALGITSIALTGANAGDFNLASNNCTASLASGRSCRVTVRFRPTAVGLRTAALTITTNDPGIPVANVTLTGTGIQAAVSLVPTSHAFGTVTRGSNSQPFAFTLTNSGTAAADDQPHKHRRYEPESVLPDQQLRREPGNRRELHDQRDLLAEAAEQLLCHTASRGQRA